MTGRVVELIEQAGEQWRGCAWATCFGRAGLNLEGIWSSQARLMARATTGQEAADWRHAALWLEQVEEDARQARASGRRAAALAGEGRLAAALQELHQACALESRYPEVTVWQSAHRALAAGLTTSA